LQDQLKENMGAFGKELSEEALADINAVYKRFKDPATSA
jgi:aryl-alcohol dehydrogenase-like predicted oxidoreductase